MLLDLPLIVKQSFIIYGWSFWGQVNIHEHIFSTPTPIPIQSLVLLIKAECLGEKQQTPVFKFWLDPPQMKQKCNNNRDEEIIERCQSLLYNNERPNLNKNLQSI